MPLQMRPCISTKSHPRPNTVQRATQLLSLAAAVLTETRGRYRVEYPEPEKLSVKKDELEKYQHIHQSAVTQQADGFSY